MKPNDKACFAKVIKFFVVGGFVGGIVIPLALWLIMQIPITRTLLIWVFFISTLGILVGACAGIIVNEIARMLALAILVIAMFFTLFSIDPFGILNVWILVMAFFVIFLAVLAAFITGRPMGLFIDSRERMSLANLQTCLWTVILLPAFFTVAAAFIQAGSPENAFDIALQPELWALMGISVTTLAGTPLIKDVKSQKTVDPKALNRYAVLNKKWIVQNAPQMGIALSGADEDQQYAELIKNRDNLNKVLDELHDGPLANGPCPATKDSKQASFLDLFRGDEIVDCHRVDLGKVQMFFFTVIGALAYMLVLATWIPTLTPTVLGTAANAAAASGAVHATADAAANTAAISFPSISDGFIAILAISHAGFLGYTAAPKTPEAR